LEDKLIIVKIISYGETIRIAAGVKVVASERAMAGFI